MNFYWKEDRRLRRASLMEMHIHERVHGLITAAVDTHTLRVIRPTYFYSATFSVLSGLYAPEMSANFNRFFSHFSYFPSRKMFIGGLSWQTSPGRSKCHPHQPPIRQRKSVNRIWPRPGANWRIIPSRGEISSSLEGRKICRSTNCCKQI